MFVGGGGASSIPTMLGSASRTNRPTTEALIASIEEKADQLLNELVELEAKGNNVIYTYITHLGLYVLLFNVFGSMLEAHREYRNWVFVAGMLLGVGLIVEFCIYYSKILNIWRLSASLLRKLRATREEVGSLVSKIETHKKRAKDQDREKPDSLVNKNGTHQKADERGVSHNVFIPDEGKVDDGGKGKGKAETGEVVRPSEQESTGLETLSKRARAIAALSDIDGSVSNFYLKYLLQLIIPLAALVVVITVMTYVASKHDSGKTLAAPVPPAPPYSGFSDI